MACYMKTMKYIYDILDWDARLGVLNSLDKYNNSAILW